MYEEFFNYKIPSEIKDKIPEYFYYALGGEFVSIFGTDSLIKDEDGYSIFDYNSSTSGYVAAFKATCKKLDMDWLFEYWKTLPWEKSDMFDDEIVEEVMKVFDKDDSANSYYKYLVGCD